MQRSSKLSSETNISSHRTCSFLAPNDLVFPPSDDDLRSLADSAIRSTSCRLFSSLSFIFQALASGHAIIERRVYTTTVSLFSCSRVYSTARSFDDYDGITRGEPVCRIPRFAFHEPLSDTFVLRVAWLSLTRQEAASLEGDVNFQRGRGIFPQARSRFALPATIDFHSRRDNDCSVSFGFSIERREI